MNKELKEKIIKKKKMKKKMMFIGKILLKNKKIRLNISNEEKIAIPEKLYEMREMFKRKEEEIIRRKRMEKVQKLKSLEVQEHHIRPFRLVWL